MKTNFYRYRWLGFSIIIAVFFIVYFHRVSTSVLVPDLLKTFGVSSTVLGVMASAYFYSYGTFQPIVGILVDRYKPRRVISMCAFLMGVGSLTFALAPNFLVALVARVIIGVGAGGVFVPITWYISRWFDSSERAFPFSLVLVSGNAGAVIAAGPLGVLVAVLTWRSAILVVTAVTFILAALTFTFVRSEPEGASSSKNNENSAYVSDSKNSSVKTGWLGILKATLGQRDVRYALSASFLMYGALMSFQGLWGVPFLIDVYGYSRSTASGLITILPIGFIIGCLTLGKLLDTKMGKLIYVMGYLTSTIIYFILTTATNYLTPFELFLCIFMLGFANAVFPFVLKLYSQVFPHVNFGAAMGIVNSFPFFGGVVFQPLTGFVFDFFTSHSLVAYRYFFLLLTITTVIATINASRVRVPQAKK